MPSRNRNKIYVEGGHYHIYNRGVDKRLIFQDREDYTRFLYLLKIYLSPTDKLHSEYPLLRPNIINNNLYEQIKLLAFCLMPNHFHLLVKQNSKDGITKLMRQITTAYTIYFNKRHERTGPLLGGVYKAALVENDDYLLHLTRYIHLNPLDRGATIDEFEWSSYLYYLGKKEAQWLDTKSISDYFSSTNPNLNYKAFVEDFKAETPLDQNLTIEQN